MNKEVTLLALFRQEVAGGRGVRENHREGVLPPHAHVWGAPLCNSSKYTLS